MGEPKFFASLSPRLLARKGGAKPAMRPQVQPLVEYQVDLSPPSDEPQDDLGWNDMGEEEELGVELQAERPEAEIVVLNGASAPTGPKTPEIVAQQSDLVARLERRPGAELKLGQRRAAFTLRLDPDRHLQLRLASTVSGRSAQALLTEALDRMLEELPEIQSLADNIRKRS